MLTVKKDVLKLAIELGGSPDSDEWKALVRGVSFGASEVSIEDVSLSNNVLELLQKAAKQIGDRGQSNVFGSLLNMRLNPDSAKVGSVKALHTGLIDYIRINAIDGWLYEHVDGGVAMPWLVREIQFLSATKERTARVDLMLCANTSETSSSRGYGSRTITFTLDDIVRRTLPEALAAKHFVKETPELKSEYMRQVELFWEYQPMFGKQFSAERNAYKVKVVNDEEILKRKFTPEVSNWFWANMGIETFSELPMHCVVYAFDMVRHCHVWVHVDKMQPYQYDSSLKDKLVLPVEHRDLVDILATDMDVLLDDIVEGKSGGTTILCKGSPGLGKTLTAEVYSEVVERPLYRVHSGQLGTSSASVEKNLKEILDRSSRWGAVMLIDEADVYIRKRGNDLDHNAVVASFLRTLEYFDGLLFMTTNRSEDIDDAILSRCIAMIKFETPSPVDAKRIWRVLSDQFSLDIKDSLIDELVAHFNTASGRDIKELLKLTSKFCRRKEIPLNFESFRQCAQFKGL